MTEKKKDYFEFRFNVNENLIEKVRGFNEIPTGKCSIEFHTDDEEPKLRYINGRKRNMSKEGRLFIQYLEAPDINYNDIARNKIIKEEMTKNNITEITVSLFKSYDKKIYVEQK
jgi:hypothetical protein